MLGVPEFEVRHVNVHHAVHELNALEAIVGRSVIDQR